MGNAFLNSSILNSEQIRKEFAYESSQMSPDVAIFCHGKNTRETDIMDDYYETFQLFDRDNDNLISAADLKAIMASIKDSFKFNTYFLLIIIVFGLRKSEAFLFKFLSSHFKFLINNPKLTFE